jgi:signal peptidase I
VPDPLAGSPDEPGQADPVTLPGPAAPAGRPARADEKRTGRRPGKTPGHLLRDLLVMAAIAGVVALLIKAFVIQAFRIPSASMENTLQVGDRVLVNKLVYHLRGIHRGDIVVFGGQGSWGPPAAPLPANPVDRAFHDALRAVGLETAGTDYIKRVIGLPGDRVACCDSRGRVMVNGVPLSESSYLYPGVVPSAQRFSILVPQGRLWVMGDHRDDSADSRYYPDAAGHGTIPQSAVVGRAFAIVWPPSQLRVLSIPGTFGQAALSAAGPAAPAIPLAAGSAVAIPLTWLMRWGRTRRVR